MFRDSVADNVKAIVSQEKQAEVKTSLKKGLMAMIKTGSLATEQPLQELKEISEDGSEVGD